MHQVDFRLQRKMIHWEKTNKLPWLKLKNIWKWKILAVWLRKKGVYQTSVVHSSFLLWKDFNERVILLLDHFILGLQPTVPLSVNLPTDIVWSIKCHEIVSTYSQFPKTQSYFFKLLVLSIPFEYFQRPEGVQTKYNISQEKTAKILEK